jgi:hypothetical protein
MSAHFCCSEPELGIAIDSALNDGSFFYEEKKELATKIS